MGPCRRLRLLAHHQRQAGHIDRDISANFTTPLQQDDVDAYRRDGAVVLRNLVTPRELQRLREGIEHNLAEPGALAGTASADSDPGRFFEDFCNWQRIPAYQDVIFGSELGRVSAQLMGSRTVRLFHEHLLIKEAHTEQPTPYHQDQPYYNVDGSQNVSFWIPVDPVPLSASLSFVAASHASGTWFLPKSFLTEQTPWFPPGSLAEAPPITSETPLLQWALQPGDVLAFHMLTLHGSAGTKTLRRAFSVRFLGDDMVHAPRTWRTSPQFEGLTEQLAPGAPMEHSLFPLVFQVDCAIDGVRH